MAPMPRGNCFNRGFPSSGAPIQCARLVGLAVGAYRMLKGIDRILTIAFNATQPITGGLNMCRMIAAFFLLLASAVTASAQGLFPSIWQTQQGALLKVLSVDPAG